MERVVSGNEAVAYGAMLARVQVIPAYPISRRRRLSKPCRIFAPAES